MNLNILTKYWHALTPLTQHICLFTWNNIIVINTLLIVSFSTPMHDTVLEQSKDFLLLRQEVADSWEPMEQAFEYTQSEHKKPLYSEIFFAEKTKFQYPLTSLIIFYPLNIINNFIQQTSMSWLGLLKGLSWILLALEIYILIQIFNFSLKSNIPQNTNYFSSFDLFTRNALICCLALTFYPLLKAYTLGQIQDWINSLFALLIWCWMKEKKGISGVISGTMCLIKPQYSIILLWGLLRKQWSFTITFAITIFTGILAAILLFGVADTINYLSVLSFISKHGESFYPNQSINGLMNRLLFNGNNLQFTPHSFPPFNAWVYVGTTISSMTLISLALFQPKRTNRKGDITDLAIVALTCTIASPIAWEHHYGILLPIYAFLLPCLLKKQIFGLATFPYLCVSYILSSNYFSITQKLADAQFNLNIIQSYLLVGGIMVLICLYVLRSAEIKNDDRAQSGMY